MARTLTLRTEHLTELSQNDLSAVVGGAITLICVPTQRGCTGYYPTLNAPCDTVQNCIQTG